MALVVAGEYNLDKTLGWVAGRCAVCGQLTLLRAKNIVRQGHAWFIPIESRRLLYTELKCQQCGGKSSCEQKAFASFLPKEEANSLHFGEVLLRTNPGLANNIGNRARLEEEVRNSAGQTLGGRDPRVELAFAKIAELNRNDPRVIQWQASLAQWGTLDEAYRRQLLAEIDTRCAEQERGTACAHFLRLMAERFKPDFEGLPKLMCFVLPLLPCIAFTMVFLNKDQTTMATGLFLSFVPSFVVGFLMNRFFLRRLHRRFYRTVFLPEVERRNVELETVVSMLCQVDVKDQRIDPRVRAMAKSLPLLQEMLVDDERGLEIPAIQNQS